MSLLGLNNASESISFLDALTPGSCNILAKCVSGLRIVCCLPVFSPCSLFSDGPTTNPDAETEPRCQPFTPAPSSSSPCAPHPCLTDFWLCLVLFSVHSSDSNRDLTSLSLVSLLHQSPAWFQGAFLTYTQTIAVSCTHQPQACNLCQHNSPASQ